MAKSYAEVRAICHQPKTDTVYTRVFYRRLSVPITYLLQFTLVSANMVSFAGMFCGLAAFALFCLGEAWAFLVGALLWQLMLLADHVDGEVARVKGTSGLRGAFVEYVIIHAIGHPLTFVGLGIGAWRQFGDPTYVWLGLAATMAVMVSIVIFLLRLQLFAFQYRRQGLPRFPGAPDDGPTGAPPKPQGLGYVVAAGQATLRIMAGIIEVAILLTVGGLVDVIGGAMGVLPLEGAWLFRNAATTIVIAYGTVFTLGTIASFLDYARNDRRLMAEYDGFSRWMSAGERR